MSSKTKKTILSLVAVILALILFPLFVPVVTAPSVQTYDISSKIPYAYAVKYDTTSNVVYLASWSSSSGKVGLFGVGSLLSNGVSAITVWNVFPFSSGTNVGNFAGGAYDIVYSNGFVWATAVYNMGIGLAKVNPSTGAYTNYFLYDSNGGPSPRSIVSDGTNLYISFGSKIAVFNIASETWTTITIGNTVEHIYLKSGRLYFTYNSGVGYVGTDGGQLTLVNTGYSGSRLTEDSSGNIWFVANTAHKVAKFIAGVVTSYDVSGHNGDGPYGLQFDNDGKLWLFMFAGNQIRQFNPSTNTIDVSKDIITAFRPVMGIKDNLGRIWGIGRGSSDLFYFDPSSTTTTTTISPTTSTTTQTTSSTSTATSTSTSTQTQTTTTTATSTGTTTTSTTTSTSTSTTTSTATSTSTSTSTSISTTASTSTSTTTTTTTQTTTATTTQTTATATRLPTVMRPGFVFLTPVGSIKTNGTFQISGYIAQFDYTYLPSIFVKATIQINGGDEIPILTSNNLEYPIFWTVDEDTGHRSGPRANGGAYAFSVTVSGLSPNSLPWIPHIVTLRLYDTYMQLGYSVMAFPISVYVV